MKNLFKASLGAFIVCVVFSMLGFTANCENLTDKIIRFHIPAASDSEYDQNVKLKVKDEVFSFVTEITENSTDKSAAEKVIEENLTQIEEKANQILKLEGAAYKAKAELINEYFTTREYDTFTLPAGNYTALKITLGSGEGKNWWCALYPSLCVASSGGFESLSESECELITEKEENEYAFKFYEWFLNIKEFIFGKAA